MSSTIRVFSTDNKLALMVEPDEKLKFVSSLTKQTNYNIWQSAQITSALEKAEIVLPSQDIAKIISRDVFKFPADTTPLIQLSDEQITAFITELFKTDEVEISLDINTDSLKISKDLFPTMDVKDISPSEVVVLFGNTAFGLKPQENFFDSVEPALRAAERSFSSAMQHMEGKYAELERTISDRLMQIILNTNSLPPFWNPTQNWNKNISYCGQSETRYMIQFFYPHTQLRNVVDRNGKVYRIKKEIFHPPFRVFIEVKKDTSTVDAKYALRANSDENYLSFHSSNYICMGNAILSGFFLFSDVLNAYALIESVFETANLIGMFGTLTEKIQKELRAAVWYDGRFRFDEEWLHPSDNKSATITFSDSTEGVLDFGDSEEEPEFIDVPELIEEDDMEVNDEENIDRY